jgi:hypothetical protein
VSPDPGDEQALAVTTDILAALAGAADLGVDASASGIAPGLTIEQWRALLSALLGFGLQAADAAGRHPQSLVAEAAAGEIAETLLAGAPRLGPRHAPAPGSGIGASPDHGR